MSFISGRSSRRKNSFPVIRSAIEPLEVRRLLATFTVTTTSDTVNPADGKLSLREAITKANLTAASDTVVLKSGKYAITRAGADEDENDTGDFDILAPLTIKGVSMDKTIIDGMNLDRVFHI